MITLVLLLASTLIGYAIGFFSKKTSQIGGFFLPFSGAYLLTITVSELLPEVFENLDHKASIFILIGIGSQLLLDVLTKGIEHGHFHIKKKSEAFSIVVGLFLHAFLEATALKQHTVTPLLWMIVVHKIPVAVLLFHFSNKLNLKKWQFGAFLFTFLIIAPLGLSVGNLLEGFSFELLAIVTGIFLHISSIILFESADNHKYNYKKLVAIAVGVLIGISIYH